MACVRRIEVFLAEDNLQLSHCDKFSDVLQQTANQPVTTRPRPAGLAGIECALQQLHRRRAPKTMSKLAKLQRCLMFPGDTKRAGDETALIIWRNRGTVSS